MREKNLKGMSCKKVINGKWVGRNPFPAGRGEGGGCDPAEATKKHNPHPPTPPTKNHKHTPTTNQGLGKKELHWLIQR